MSFKKNYIVFLILTIIIQNIYAQETIAAAIDSQEIAEKYKLALPTYTYDIIQKKEQEIVIELDGMKVELDCSSLSIDYQDMLDSLTIGYGKLVEYLPLYIIKNVLGLPDPRNPREVMEYALDLSAMSVCASYSGVTSLIESSLSDSAEYLKQLGDETAPAESITRQGTMATTGSYIPIYDAQVTSEESKDLTDSAAANENTISNANTTYASAFSSSYEACYNSYTDIKNDIKEGEILYKLPLNTKKGKLMESACDITKDLKPYSNSYHVSLTEFKLNGGDDSTITNDKIGLFEVFCSEGSEPVCKAIKGNGYEKLLSLVDNKIGTFQIEEKSYKNDPVKIHFVHLLNKTLQSIESSYTATELINSSDYNYSIQIAENNKLADSILLNPENNTVNTSIDKFQKIEEMCYYMHYNPIEFWNGINAIVTPIEDNNKILLNNLFMLKDDMKNISIDDNLYITNYKFFNQDFYVGLRNVFCHNYSNKYKNIAKENIEKNIALYENLLNITVSKMEAKYNQFQKLKAYIELAPEAYHIGNDIANDISVDICLTGENQNAAYYIHKTDSDSGIIKNDAYGMFEQNGMSLAVLDSGLKYDIVPFCNGKKQITGTCQCSDKDFDCISCGYDYESSQFITDFEKVSSTLLMTEKTLARELEDSFASSMTARSIKLKAMSETVYNMTIMLKLYAIELDRIDIPFYKGISNVK